TAQEDDVSAPEKDEALAAPVLKRDWRFYTGMTAFALSFVMPLGAAIVPALGLPFAQSALLAGALIAGGPEVMCILAVVLLGKDTFKYFSHTAKRALRRLLGEQPASRGRYYTGLAILGVSTLPAYIFAYFPEMIPGGDARIYVLV